MRSPRTTRITLLAIALTLLAVYWVNLDELIHASIAVGNAVPPIPALAAILILVGVTYLGVRVFRKTLIGRKNILLIYISIAFASSARSICF